MKRCRFLLFVILYLTLYSSAYSQEADSTSYGWFSVSVNVDSLWVVFNQDYKNSSFYMDGDSLRVKTGSHSIILTHPDYRDVRALVDIKPGQHTKLFTSFLRGQRFDSSLSSYKRITEGLEYNISIMTDESSFIVINDSTYGQGSVITDIGPYQHDIRIEHPKARNRSETVYINPSGQINLSIYALPKRSTALMYSVIPGSSQIYKNQTLKGFALRLTIPATAVLAGYMHFSFNQQNDEYKDMLFQYSTMTDEREVFEFGNLVQGKFNSVKQTARVRDYAIVAAAGLYLYNVLDAIFVSPKSGYRLQVEPADFSTLNGSASGLKMSLNF